MAKDTTTCICTMVNLHTRTGEAASLRKQRTKHIDEAFVMKWIRHYGFARVIVFDNGPGFASKIMKEAMKLLGIKTPYVLPHHPEPNGACKTLNATIYIVFAYNTSVHASTGFTQAAIGSEALARVREENEHVGYPTYVNTYNTTLQCTSTHLSTCTSSC